MAKMKVQVMTINSVQESSKSELSSGIFDHVKERENCLQHAPPERVRHLVFGGYEGEAETDS